MGDDGPLIEQLEGVSRASLILHEDDVLLLGVLVDKRGGVFEAAQRGRREGTNGINKYDPKGEWNAVNGVLWVRVLRALTKRARTVVLHVAGVINAVGRLLHEHIQALAVDVPHAPVPETSSPHPQGRSIRSFREGLPTAISSAELHSDGASDLADVIHCSDFIGTTTSPDYSLGLSG